MSIIYTNDFQYPLPRVIPIYENVSDGETLGQFYSKYVMEDGFAKDYDKDDIKYDIMTIDKHNLSRMKHIGLLINENGIDEGYICDPSNCQYSVVVPFDTLDNEELLISVVFYTIKDNIIYFGLVELQKKLDFIQFKNIPQKNGPSTDAFLYEKICQNDFVGKLDKKHIKNMYKYIYTATQYIYVGCLIDSHIFFSLFQHGSVREIPYGYPSTPLLQNPKYELKSMTVDELEDELKSMLVDELKSMTVDELKSMTVDELKSMLVDKLKSMTVDELKSMTVYGLKSVLVDKLKSMTVDELKSMTVDELKSMLVDEFKSMLVDELKSMTVDKLESMTVDELKSMLVDELKSKTVDELKSKTVYELKSMLVDKLKSMTVDELKSMTVVKLKIMLVDELKSMTVDELKSMIEDKLKSMTVNKRIRINRELLFSMVRVITSINEYNEAEKSAQSKV
jgi:hypothetical protein